MGDASGDLAACGDALCGGQALSQLREVRDGAVVHIRELFELAPAAAPDRLGLAVHDFARLSRHLDDWLGETA